jgi:cardiolipin synthase
VRLVADAHAMHTKDREDPRVMAQIVRLRAAGVAIRLSRDPARPYDADHRKMLLVDGEALIIGGRNLADHYAGPAWRDVDLLIRGPSAGAAAAVFERTFHREPEPPRRPGQPGELIQATLPESLEEHANVVYLLQCVGAARRTIDIENAYYFSHPAVLRALAAARGRGVRVRVLTNSAASNDIRFANYRLYLGFPGMIEAGVEVHLRRGEGKTLHSKYFVVDGAWVSLGSSNFDYYSPRHCAEANVQVESEELGAALTRFFESGLAEADRLEDPREIDAVLRASGWSRAVDVLLRDVQ